MAAFMTDEKPTVWVLTSQSVEDQVVFHVLSGLEEEGIPSQVHERLYENAPLLGMQAAEGSSLNVGIGISSSERSVVLYHRDLGGGAPLFCLAGDNYRSPELLRRLGANAGRLVKGNPLSM